MKSHYLIKLSFDLTHCKSLYLLSEITTDIYQCALRSQSVLSTDIISKQPPLLLTCDKPQCALCAGFVRCLQPVLVSRQDPDSRKNTIQEIDSRAKSGGHWPQVRHNTGKKNILHAKKMAPMFTVAAEKAFSLSPVSQDVGMVSQFPLSGSEDHVVLIVFPFFKATCFKSTLASPVVDR